MLSDDFTDLSLLTISSHVKQQCVSPQKLHHAESFELQTVIIYSHTKAPFYKLMSGKGKWTTNIFSVLGSQDSSKSRAVHDQAISLQVLI
jgi:hypothetical protein